MLKTFIISKLLYFHKTLVINYLFSIISERYLKVNDCELILTMVWVKGWLSIRTVISWLCQLTDYCLCVLGMNCFEQLPLTSLQKRTAR